MSLGEGKIERLAPIHDLSQFRNERHKSLDEWLRKRARRSEGLSARTYVACPLGDPLRVVGYYAISAAEIERGELPNAKLRRELPERVPMMLLGRLAVDVGYQGAGLGTTLLADAIRNCLIVSEMVGVRAILAHAIDMEAAQFYRRSGFVMSPVGENIMILPIQTARELFPDWVPPPYPSTSS